MKYKKICKRLIAFILCTTISIQSFFSAEIPAYAGQSTPSAMDSLEDLTEDNYDDLEIDLYDDTGTKLVPLSPESIALLTYGNLDDELNPFIENDLEIEGISLYSASLSLLGFFCICIIGYGVFAVSQKIITDTINYFKTYAFPSHGSSFVTTDFEFINSSGQVESYEITQSMMESIGLKLSSIENGTFWEPVLGLSDEDKLCIAYVMYKQGFLTNLKRENINITKPVAEIIEKYPYYIMAGTTKEMWQVCFDKKPIGAFCGISTSKYPMYDYYGNQIYVKGGNTIFYSGYKIKYDNGTTKLLLDICNTCLIPYKLNDTFGCFDSMNTITEYVPKVYSSTDETLLYTGPGSISDDAKKQFPFHFYKTLSVGSNTSDMLLRVISATADYTQSSSRYDFNIVNFPHVINIEDYYNSLPDLLELNNTSFTLDSSLNLDVATSYLNPVGVRTWDGADVRPTEVPTESVKPSESVQPSEGGGGFWNGDCNSYIYFNKIIWFV